MGQFVESTEVQLVVAVLVLADIAANNALLLLPSKDDSKLAAMAFLPAARNLLQSFTAFTLFFFALELAVLLVSFRRRFFRQWGYCYDLCVIAVCLHAEAAGWPRTFRLSLTALRCWRVLRLFHAALAAETDAHKATCGQLAAERRRAAEAVAAAARLEESGRRELESRKRVEAMLRGYKDEVDTLNEALKIAAASVMRTAVGGGSENDDDDDDDGIGGTGVGGSIGIVGGGGVSTGAIGGSGSASGHGVGILRGPGLEQAFDAEHAAVVDAIASQANTMIEGSGGSNAAGAAAGGCLKPGLIIVNEDGTFEYT
ncbi:unnamed protein product [Phaeothamnion confervicola]